MAVNKQTFKYNLLTGATKPLIMPGLFAAGSTKAIKAGEIIERTNTSNTIWVPIDSDFLMVGNIAVMGEEIKSGDRAGYYKVIVPRPFDVFEYALSAAGAPAIGAPLYFSASQVVAVAGTYELGRVVGFDHYPRFQGHLADDASPDSGVTIRNTSYVQMMFNPVASWWEAFARSSWLNAGDAGGFSGLFWDAANTTLDLYVDGTQTAHIAADGTYNDDVG